MSDKYKNFKELYVELKPMSSSLVLGLIIITFGFYIINWIYQRNVDFLKFDSDAPDPKRGALLLFVIPVSWFIIMKVLINLLFDNIFFRILENLGWLLILLLILKYLFDFSIVFGEITKTFGFFWFIFLSLGFLGLFFGVLFNKYFFILTIFLFIFIPAMQEEINKIIKKYNYKKSLKVWYG
jgi:hypothetical protein